MPRPAGVVGLGGPSRQVPPGSRQGTFEAALPPTHCAPALAPGQGVGLAVAAGQRAALSNGKWDMGALWE